MDEPNDDGGSVLRGLSGPFFTRGPTSWTDILPKNEHVDLFRRTDYGQTTLGPIAEWGPALRFYTSMLFADSRGACIYWGPDRVATYNEKSAEVFGEVHPKLVGSAFQDIFSEIDNDIGPIFDRATETGQAVDIDNIQLFPNRNGYIEETYFIGQIIPLRGDSGEIEGFYNTVYESTTQVLHERRRKLVDSIASMPPCSIDEAFVHFMEALRGNPHDIPMALLYSFDEFAKPGTGNLRLRGNLSVPDNHPCAPHTADLGADDDGVIPFLRTVNESGKPLVLSQSNGTLQAYGNLFEGVAWCGYGEPSRDIVVLPLSSGGRNLGFYVQGTNPRRVYDDVTERSIVDLARQMEGKWLSCISTEEVRATAEELERRLTKSEYTLRYMAQSAPLGMCQISPARGGTIEWANEQFYEITGHARTKPAMADFWNIIAPEDRERSSRDLATLFEEDTRVVSELRLTRKWSPPVYEDDDAVDNTAWILTVSFPVFENGKAKLVMGYLYDISHQKWAESVQTRNAAAATQAKRRQEEFIDVTSHEMRNPLTAIVQLADGISNSLRDIEDSAAARETYRAVAHSNIESSNTILACAAHLQRVIDDVLMLSRLESQMLSITPVVAQLVDVVANTVKMFDGEIALHGTKIEIVRDVSYNRLHVDYVLCDTSRLMQVLINLISNAIKFTATRLERKISVVYGVQQRRPPTIRTIFGDLDWMALRDEQNVNSALPDLENGEAPLYLYFCIQDTGPGVTPSEMERLFQRFSQANSKTHISYGGSGLGLYICRELAEKQGGGVGVASQHNRGSVFGFYIESRRAKAPEQTKHAPSSTLARPRTLSTERPDLPQRLTSRTDIRKVDGELDEASLRPQLCAPQQDTQAEGYHVLLVEDNIINQKILAKQLRAAKCTVTVANEGEECLGVLKTTDCWRSPATQEDNQSVAGSTRIDVILMDWEMPIMNGLACCKRIRQLESEGHFTRSLPIIAITANVWEEQLEQAVSAGMDNVMTKPFIVSDLLTRIQDTIRTRADVTVLGRPEIKHQ